MAKGSIRSRSDYAKALRLMRRKQKPAEPKVRRRKTGRRIGR